MVPAHFHDVTDDKMKSNLVKNTAGPQNQFNHGNYYKNRSTLITSKPQ